MPKKALTKEQEVNLLWLEIKKNNQEIAPSTYKAVKSCILNNKPIKHLKISQIEKQYLAVFTMPQNGDFIAECFRIQSKLKEMSQIIKQTKDCQS